MEKERPFKVLIVGGSITGLTLAAALARADIDFLVLEGYGKIDPTIGAALTVPTNALRIYDQMGIYDDIKAHIKPCTDVYTYQENDKSKVLLNKRIIRVDHSDTGVVAHCEDGTEYTGSMIAGADGVHSTIRGEMWKFMEQSRKGKKKAEKDRKAMTAEFACIFGISSPVEGLKPGIIYRTWGKNFTNFANVGEDNQVFWVLFTKMDQKFQYPNVPKFTRVEQDALVKKYADSHVAEGIKLGTIYENMTSSSFIALEEGVCKLWTWGRFACLGDSVHKTTPNIGQGAGMAIADAASLANHIVSIAKSSDGMPSSDDITAGLKKWAGSLRPRAQSICDAGALYMRLEALANWPLKLAGLYIAPHIPTVFADLLSVLDIGGPTLNFLALPETKNDSVSTEKEANKRKWKVSWYIRAFWAANLKLK
ncbi:hypothetical protein N7466_011178 [Penicillium verhagenii]|uniref:uncharacterized protein n=1 Tax=Penicillium verhagenii TaxID=1562060 RepID=UPI0025453A53|nr:uncharacterized protein N7466_011178 [Penicillium verhagenii]KAJ5917624.1 hypothetical protein N7466_011178 [Penicillium verhagenii]